MVVLLIIEDKIIKVHFSNDFLGCVLKSCYALIYLQALQIADEYYYLERLSVGNANVLAV